MAEHPNAEAVRRGYSAFANAEMEGIQSLFADDVVWHVGGRSPLSGDYRGKEAVLGFLGDLVSQTGGTYGGEVHDVMARTRMQPRSFGRPARDRERSSTRTTSTCITSPTAR
jgi:ketosteroid isomerase-like protein